METLIILAIAAGFVLVGIALIKAPDAVWDVMAGFAYRNPSRAYPSARRLRLMQAQGAVVVTLALAVIAGFVTGGRGGEPWEVAAWILLAGILVTLVMLVRVFTLPKPDERDLPANEPADLSYALAGAATAFGLLGMAMTAVILLSVPTKAERYDEWVEKGREKWEQVLLAEHENWRQAPAQVQYEPRGSFVEINQATREPRLLFAVAEAMGPETTALVESSDLLLIASSNFVCPLSGAVVHEVGSDVEVALVTSVRHDISACSKAKRASDDRSVRAVLVDLDAPLGDRTVRSYREDGACEREVETSTGLTTDNVCLRGWEHERSGYFAPIPHQLGDHYQREY